MPHHLVQALAEDLAQAVAFQRVGQAGVERIDIGRQAALAPQVVPGVLVGGEDVLRIEPQALGHADQELARLDVGHVIVEVLAGEQLGVGPHRLPVLAPVEVERPARQLFTRVPLALAVVQQAAGAVLGAQLVHQVGAEQALGRAHGVGVPLGAVAVVHRHEGGFTALRQAHVVAAQVVVDLVAQVLDVAPLGLGVGQRHPRRLPHAGDGHAVLELGLALVDGATHRRGGRRVGRAGQGDVPLTGQQARGGVEADPARARHEDLAPGVQVGEVDLGAARAVERLDVALELDQVARHKARGQPQVPAELHQQPAGVAAGAAAVGQRHLGRLHAGLHADQVADVLLQALVQLDQEVGGLLLLARNAVEVFLEQRRELTLDPVGREFVDQVLVVLEGKVLGRGLEKEVEGVEHRHLGDQVDLDAEARGLVREHQPRHVVGLRILLPVDEVRGRLDTHRVAEDAGARVWRRAQADDLRSEVDRPVVPVVGHVVQRDVDGHAGLQIKISEPRRAPQVCGPRARVGKFRPCPAPGNRG